MDFGGICGEVQQGILMSWLGMGGDKAGLQDAVPVSVFSGGGCRTVSSLPGRPDPEA